eukprot:4519361-Prymnesium_polylepis.1
MAPSARPLGRAASTAQSGSEAATSYGRRAAVGVRRECAAMAGGLGCDGERGAQRDGALQCDGLRRQGSGFGSGFGLGIRALVSAAPGEQRVAEHIERVAADVRAVQGAEGRLGAQ